MSFEENGTRAPLIPKKLHYCWFGGGQKNDVILKCIASWQRFLGDYEVIEWNESNSPMDEPYVASMYRRKKWSKMANFVRLHALTNEGGIYLDTDVEVLRSFDPLLGNQCFLGFQQKDWNEYAHWVNTAVIGAQRHHPFLHEFLDAIRSLPLDSDLAGVDILKGLLIEKGLTHYGEQVVGSVRLYPSEYFYPYPWWADFHPARITENTYAIHHWQMSWVEGDPRLRRLRQKAAFYNVTSKLLGLAQPVPPLYKAIVQASSWYS